GAPGRYRFAHALIRETLDEELSTTRRIRFHREVGEALERLWGADVEAHLTELAHHFHQAAPGGDAAKAADDAARAGSRAHALIACEEAARHYAQALQALEMQHPVDEAQRYELLLEVGAAENAAGDFPAARDTFARAAGIARSLRAPDKLARAA